jgi:hypothetical protein
MDDGSGTTEVMLAYAQPMSISPVKVPPGVGQLSMLTLMALDPMGKVQFIAT